MSVHTTVNRETYVPSDLSRAEEDRRSGWVTFAGVLLLLAGTLNIIEGIAAIDNAHFFVGNTNYIAGDLNTWGWVVLFIGVAQILVGLGIFAKNQFARWTGVGVLGLNAIALYVGAGIMADLFGVIRIGGTPLGAWIYQKAFESWLPPVDASLAFAIAFVLFWLLMMWILYRRRIFLKV